MTKLFQGTTLRSRRSERGFTIIELGVVLTVIGIMASVYARYGASIGQEQRGKLIGQTVATVHNAAEDYARRYRAEILNNTAITAPAVVAVTRAPTTAEFFALGQTPNLISAAVARGGNIQIRLSPSPVGCVMPACEIQILTYLDAPVLNSNENVVARGVLAAATREAGARAGGSESFAPTRLRGLDGMWDAANPVAGNPVGIFAMMSSTADIGSSQYVRIRDSRDPDLQGPLTVAGNVAANGSLTATGATTLNGATTINNTLAVTGTAAVGRLQVNDVGVAGGACPANTFIKDASGLLLSCVAGQWKVQGDSSCIANYSDLNYLQDSTRCYNGAGNPNSPAGGEWFFLEVFRHVNPANYYTAQRVIGMTGAATGKVWIRNQQSNVSGAGWGPWQLVINGSDVGAACSPEGATATAANGLGLLCVNGLFRSMDTIIRFGTPGAACTMAGVTAINTASNNETLICKSNPADGANVLVWFRLRDLTQNLQFVFAYFVNAGGQVPKPTCPAGARQLMIATSKATSSSDGGVHVFGTDLNASNWTLNMVDGSGNSMPAQAEALVQTYCYFP